MYARVIFFPLRVQRFVEQLGHMKTIRHAAGLGQEISARLVKRRPQVGPVRTHLLTLLRRRLPQARFAGGFVSPLSYRQHFWILWVRPIGQHRDVQFVPFLQTELIDPHIGNDSIRVDLFVVAQLVAYDPAHGFRRNPQPPANLLFITADQQRKHLLLKAIRVGNVFAFEGRQDIVAMLALGTTVPRRLIDPETWLSKDVQVPNHADAIGNFQPCLILQTATRAGAALRPRPSHFETVAVAVTFIRGDFHTGRKIDINADSSHGGPCLNESSFAAASPPEASIVSWTG